MTLSLSRVSFLLLLWMFSVGADAAASPLKVKVFIASMFEIGANTGDRAGEFQLWYEQYLRDSQVVEVKGAKSDVYCNADGVCGSVLGMGKVGSSASLQAILLSPELDFSQAYFVLTGVAGIPPDRGTIGDVSWASYVVDYDLGHRWAAGETPENMPLFMPRSGYEGIRCYVINPQLLVWAEKLSLNASLKDSDDAQRYRKRYHQNAALAKPRVKSGTHMTGDTFFHGPGLSAEAEYMSQLYQVDHYQITEMEAAALLQVLSRYGFENRALSLRAAVNFDQGNQNESTLSHLDPAPGETAGGFENALENMTLVGRYFIDHLIQHWPQWQQQVPLLPGETHVRSASATACSVDPRLLVNRL